MPDPVATLTSKQRAHLRSLAHRLKPVVQVGTEGVTPAVLASIEDALRTRELLKVKILEGAPVDVRDAAEALSTEIDGAHVPQVIGRTVVLYRPFDGEPEIRLPL